MIGTSDSNTDEYAVSRGIGAGLLEIVEAQMQSAPWRHRHAIRANRLAILKENGDAHLCRLIAGVEEARRLMRFQSALGERALGGNPTFSDGPAFAAEGIHERVAFQCMTMK